MGLAQRLSARRAELLVFLTPALVFLATTLPHLDQGDYRKDTGRYAAVGLQAWQNGHWWTLRFTPERVYFNKPPLAMWIHGWFLDTFGINLVATRIPTILAGLIVVLCTVGLVRTFGTRRSAVAAGVVLAMSYEFFRRTREISLDMWQLAFMMLALLLIALGVRTKSSLCLILGGVPIGLALMTKPFVGVVVVPIVLLWVLLIGERKAVLPILLAGLVGLAVASPWHIGMTMEHGSAFWDQYLGRQVAGRAAGAINPQGLEYYPVLFLKTYWPWMIPFALGVVHWIRSPRSRRIVLGMVRAGLMLVGIWLCAWIVTLMAFPDKRPRYTPPVYPALAVIAGAWLASGSSPGVRRATSISMRWAWAGAIVIGAVLAMAPIRFQSPPEGQREEFFAWHEAQDQPEFYTLGVNTNSQGILRLRLGAWPRSLGDEMLDRIADPPPGSLVLVRDDVQDPPAGEVLWISSKERLRVVRVGIPPAN